MKYYSNSINSNLVYILSIEDLSILINPPTGASQKSYAQLFETGIELKLRTPTKSDVSNPKNKSELKPVVVPLSSAGSMIIFYFGNNPVKHLF